MPDPIKVTENGGKDYSAINAWARAIGVIGIPGAIAIFLVYIGATEVPKLVRAVESLVVEQKASRDLMYQHIGQTDVLYRALTRICVNLAQNAKDDNAIQRCFDR